MSLRLLLAAALLVPAGIGDLPAQSHGPGEGTLAGRVLSPADTPLADAVVADLSSAREVRTDGRGRFSFDAAARGFHVLLVSHPRLGADTVRTAVVPGKRVAVTLTFRQRGDLRKSVRLADRRTGTTPTSTPADDRAGAAGSARIVGRLVDDEADRPVEAATLVLEGGGRSAVTDSDGRFTLDSVPGGAHRLRVEHVGYGPRELELRVPPGRTADVRIGLAPRAVRLPPIDVEVNLRPRNLVEAGFYERRRIGRRVGAGHFILGEELRRRAVDLSSALSTVPGLRSSGAVEIQGQLVTGLLYFPRYDEERFGTCLPAIYLDAHKVVGSGSPPKALRGLGSGGVSSLASVAAVSGVEVYDSPASTLGRFQGSDSRCGVIAIWTQTG